SASTKDPIGMKRKYDATLSRTTNNKGPANDFWHSSHDLRADTSLSWAVQSRSKSTKTERRISLQLQHRHLQLELADFVLKTSHFTIRTGLIIRYSASWVGPSGHALIK